MENFARAALYDDLLRHQVELSFDLELCLFEFAPNWRAAKSVLDFGAGNGYYSRKVASRYPDKSITCVEKDPLLVAKAQAWTKGQSISVLQGSYPGIAVQKPFDFVYARHVASYMPDRHAFAAWVAANTSESAEVLLVDADDSKLFADPPLPTLFRGNEDFKSKVASAGGDRDVLQSPLADWHAAGFAEVWRQPIVVHSSIIGRREIAISFLRTVAQWDHGAALSEELESELGTWMHNPNSHFQFGIIGCLLKKQTSNSK